MKYDPILDIGPFRFCIEGCPDNISAQLSNLYDASLDYNVTQPIDYWLSIKSTSFLRKIIKPQVCIYIDNQRPFNPIKKSLLLPSIEWGMNWCIASYNFTYLLIHASVLVKNNKAILFPAMPGSGKSTLAAYFGLRDWTLYSDEMAIINIGSNTVLPMHRPASLKNSSIEIIKQSSNSAVFSPTTYGTHKGDIAHLKTIDRTTFNQLKSAEIVAVIFPKFNPISELVIEQVSSIEGFAKLAHNSFNYSVLGLQGYKTLCNVVDKSTFYKVNYSNYDGLDKFIDELVTI